MSAGADHSASGTAVSEGLKQRFLLAACILIGTAGSIFWASLSLTRAEEETMREILRLGELQIVAQRTSVRSLELATAENPGAARVARDALQTLAKRLQRESRISFSPQDSAARYVYWRLPSISREGSYADVQTRLRVLSRAVQRLAEAESEIDIAFGVSAVRAQTPVDLYVDLQELIAWHEAVMREAIWLFRFLHILAWPVMVLTLGAIWQFLIDPLWRRQMRAQRKLELREAEAIELAHRAEAANLAKSNFLATMSHEIRTPMNGVLGVAQALKAQVTDPEQRRMVTWLQESGETLLTILNDILDFSKIEAGKLELEAIDFQPDDLVRKVEALHILKASEQENSFTVRTAGPTGKAHRGDPHRILQVLHNLVSNANKFTKGGRVDVTVEADGEGWLVLKVRDSGVGMSPEQLDKVFEEFSQAEGSVSRRFGGTGLGMAIVNRLVRMMGGEITLDSELGRGTTIHVHLPLELGKAPRPRAAATNPDPGSWPELRVLAADDVDTNRMVLEMLLRQMGVTASFVPGGQEAIDAVTEATFDLMLLDISMPEIDGVEALRAIRSIEEAEGRPRCPAIAITANALTHQIEEYLAAGFDGHIAKPIKVEALREGIAAALEIGVDPSSRVA